MLPSVEWPPREDWKEHLYAYDNLRRQWQKTRKVRNLEHFMVSVDVLDSKGVHWCLCAEYDHGKLTVEWSTPQQVHSKSYLLPLPFVNWRERNTKRI